MCGITGFYNMGRGLTSDSDVHLQQMTDALVHRGPDDSGTWLDRTAGVALGHRRLSILDLSPQGHQPMRSRSGRFVLVFNGEIYNHAEVRGRLDSLGERSWRGTSDTEVLLEAIEEWGLRDTLQECVGMFALALWDREDRSLQLARDRLGEKPLYYGWSRGTFLFGSELKALQRHPSWSGEVDRDALGSYLQRGYVPGPLSIYRGIRKLSPGSVVAFSATTQPGDLPAPHPYWSARTVATRRAGPPLNAESAVDRLEEVLTEAIRLQMVADVPVGAFLSGGIDSSTIVALMQRLSDRPVRTFTIGFDEAGFDEAGYAREVAALLGTDHTELYVSPQQARDVIPRLPTLYDEPFADSSQIPTFVVSQLARQDVTVSLSGDGGDELFAGYNRYRLARRLWAMFGWLPRGTRHALGTVLRRVPASVWHAVMAVYMPFQIDAWTRQHPEDRARAVADLLDTDGPEAFYARLVTHWKSVSEVVVGEVKPRSAYDDPSQWLGTPDFTAHMAGVDMVCYLPDDILVKVDRAAMGVSLETRVPLLDHRVVDFALQLPTEFKIRDGTDKWVLRQVLDRHLPRRLFDRPKSGFGVPIQQWLKGPLRDWAEELLSESRLRQEGFFEPRPIREKWQQHLGGESRWHAYLWDILMFQAWHEARRAEG